MKSLRLFPLLLLLLVNTSCWRNNLIPDPEKPDTIYVGQEVVIYPVGSSSLDAMGTWYNQFLGKPAPDSKTDTALFYKVGGTIVVVTTDARNQQTKEPVFYWRLPKTADINEDFKRVKEFSTMDTGYEEGPQDIRADTGTEKAIQKYIALDPAGNKVGVINNPIYVPTKDNDAQAPIGQQ